MLRYVYRCVFLAAMLIAMLPSAPSLAVTAKEKMATCKFGADDQKLQGAASAKFMKNCMANRNDPRGPAAGAAQPRRPRLRAQAALRRRSNNPPPSRSRSRGAPNAVAA